MYILMFYMSSVYLTFFCRSILHFIRCCEEAVFITPMKRMVKAPCCRWALCPMGSAQKSHLCCQTMRNHKLCRRKARVSIVKSHFVMNKCSFSIVKSTVTVKFDSFMVEFSWIFCCSWWNSQSFLVSWAHFSGWKRGNAGNWFFKEKHHKAL